VIGEFPRFHGGGRVFQWYDRRVETGFKWPQLNSKQLISANYSGKSALSVNFWEGLK
jgi:hypothetical protein